MSSVSKSDHKTHIKISVVIPLYNVSEHISKAAKCLREQDFNGLEIVLVDDGSTDNSLSVFAEILQGMEVVTVRQNNTGPGGARNNGIRHASGEYIIFLDSDDFFLPDALMNIMEILEKDNPIVLFGGYVRYTSEIGLMKEKFYPFVHPASPKQITEYVLSVYRQPSWNSAWRFIVKRDFIIEYNIFFAPSLYCEDLKWVLELLETLEQENIVLSILNTPFYAYNYKRFNSIMNCKNPKRLIDLTLIIKEALPRYSNRPLVCKELVWQTFYYINEYCTFSKEQRKLMFESYRELLPMYRMTNSVFYIAASYARTPVLFHILSFCLLAVKRIRWKFKLLTEYKLRCH